jgi:hypothetical protein
MGRLFADIADRLKWLPRRLVRDEVLMIAEAAYAKGYHDALVAERLRGMVEQPEESPSVTQPWHTSEPVICGRFDGREH